MIPSNFTNSIKLEFTIALIPGLIIGKLSLIISTILLACVNAFNKSASLNSDVPEKANESTSANAIPKSGAINLNLSLFFTPFEKLIIIIIIKVAIKIGIIGNIINTNNETI